ncbi:MAG: aminoglycoside phosphotransferase family protein [Acidimicrobiales bacterium]
MAERMHADEIGTDQQLVRRLLQSQMPALAELPITIVEPWGTDNAIFRLGDELVVRLPRIAAARHQVTLEAEWLHHIGPYLSVAVPEPLAIGQPDATYPFPWAVHRWVEGDGAALDRIGDPVAFARTLSMIVAELAAVPTEGAPIARNRARPIQDYDRSARAAIASAAALVDTAAALELWEAALDAPPYGGPVRWVHGDLEGNCIVADGELCGLIDWGLACVGDPAADVAVVWSPLFTEASREVFLETLGVDDATLARARGAAVQQACAAWPYYLDTYPLIVERSRHKLRQLGIDTI